jgi:hypothetical protein
MMTVDTNWGGNVSPALINKLQQMEGKAEVDSNGQYKIKSSELWGLLSYYTRDLRLGNLDKDSYLVCNEWINFAGTCLNEGYVNSFITALSTVISMVELSQSRGGFLRKRLGTFTQEHYNEFSDKNQKKGLFSSKQQDR